MAPSTSPLKAACWGGHISTPSQEHGSLSLRECACYGFIYDTHYLLEVFYQAQQVKTFVTTPKNLSLNPETPHRGKRNDSHKLNSELGKHTVGKNVHTRV